VKLAAAFHRLTLKDYVIEALRRSLEQSDTHNDD
jgi:hypothetical protein